MKKRLLSLLLALLTLCTFAACDKEDPNNDLPGSGTKSPKNYGTFYMDESGRRQNDLIKIEITNESLVAPVTQLSYNLYNESECWQSHVNIFADIEIKREGEWVKAPIKEEIFRVHRDVWGYGEAQRIVENEVKLGDEEEYLALEAGEYRLIITLDLLVEEVITIHPTVQFTVIAPVE